MFVPAMRRCIHGATMAIKDKTAKRPFVTFYYSDVHAREAVFVSQGFSASAEGAVRASVVRVFLNEYGKALIFDRRDGALVYTVKTGAEGLRVNYGRTDEIRTTRIRTPLRRIK